jgi:hypothetical protein
VFWLVLVIALLIGVLIGLLLARLRRPQPPPPPPPPPPPQCPPPKIPDNFDPPTLSSTISVRLAGTPANGAAAAPVANQVIWVDAGDEVLVHLDSVQTRILDRVVLISIDLESDQSGRTPLIVSFALGSATDPAGLVAVTDEYPRGDGSLAARWGEAVQAALWSTLLGIAEEHATERGKAPAGIVAAPGVLTLYTGDPIGAGP